MVFPLFLPPSIMRGVDEEVDSLLTERKIRKMRRSENFKTVDIFANVTDLSKTLYIPVIKNGQ